ncbi:hypothetical protein [Streptomyces sp. NRRL S-337]|uniref:hypothetical protein n=1 Tax=Streptomyces sp. NRRL S-337 TaxID=1463900 RepID=UPI0004CA1C1E|nr:hypothetical protein [Streptomyces sp. NRRL S-337]
MSHAETAVRCKTSYVCLPCRASYKQPYQGDHERRCPRCAQPLIHVGSAFTRALVRCEVP